MNVRLSVKELRNYFERRNQFTVIFNSENQEWYWVADPIKIRMVFSKVKVLENPNIVYLIDGNNSIGLTQVSHAEIDNCCCVLGDVLRIICKCGNTYTLVVS